MKKAKVILVYILLFATILGGCGIKKENSNNEMYTREEVRQQMLTYLEEKYGEEFVEISTAYKTYGRNWEEMEVYPKGKSKDESFMVYKMTRENGEVYYTDRYVISCKQEEYKKYIESLIKPYLKEFKCRVFIKSYKTQENDLLPSISFNEFKEYVDKELYVNIQVLFLMDKENLDKSAIDAKISDLNNQIKQNVSEGNLFVYGFNDEYYKKYVLDRDEKYYDYENNTYEFREHWSRK